MPTPEQYFKPTPARDAAVDFVNFCAKPRFIDREGPVPAVVFDVDGTLVDVSSVIHLVTEGTKDFRAFHEGARACPPHQWVVDEALGHYAAKNVAVLIVTARSSRYVGPTADWLAEHGVSFDRIYMRNDGDFRPDKDVKRDILAEIREDGYEIIKAWDDNPSILDLWAEEGIEAVAVPSTNC